LAAAVAMVDQPATMFRPALVQSLLERIEHEGGMRGAADPPAYDVSYPMRAPHSFGRDYGTTGFWSGSCVALFHIELPDFWNHQRDIVIGVF
jgi:hypothetical protein